MNPLVILSFWITEPADSFGNAFVNDYPEGIELEVVSGIFAGGTISWKRGRVHALIQGGMVEDTVSRTFRTLWGFPIGYYNAFAGLELDDLTLMVGRRTFRLSPSIFWDWNPIEGLGFLYRKGSLSYLFYAGYVNGLSLPDSEALGPSVYPPGTWVDRFMAIKRMEIGPFFFGEYAIAILPPDRRIPLSLFNPFRSYMEIQWNEGLETNTFWLAGLRTRTFFLEVGIDDFQYSPSTFTKVPPDFTLHVFRKWFLPRGYLKAEVLYGSPYVFSNRKWASRWVLYHRIPALIEPDQLKFLVSLYTGELFAMAGVVFRGSYSIEQPDPYPDYTLKFPLTPPVIVYPSAKVFLEKGGDRWRVRIGAYYEQRMVLFIRGLAVLYPL